MLHDPCVNPEPLFSQDPDCLLIWLSVYPVATDGEAVYLQQILLLCSVFKSSFQSSVNVDDFVIVLLIRCSQECV